MLRSVPAEPDLVYAASFLGSDEGGEVNATITSLIANAQLHGLDQAEYRRDRLKGSIQPAQKVQPPVGVTDPRTAAAVSRR